MVVTGIWSRIVVMKCAIRNVESSLWSYQCHEQAKIINYFLKSETLLFFVGGGQKSFGVWMMGKIWSDLSNVDFRGCISVVELIMEIVRFFKWNVNECAGFKTAAEYNAFPIMTSRSLKAWSVRFIPSSPFHCQQTDEDDCAVNGWTCALYHHFHVSK